MNGRLRRWILGKELVLRIEALERHIQKGNDVIGFEVPDNTEHEEDWDNTGTTPGVFHIGDDHG